MAFEFIVCKHFYTLKRYMNYTTVYSVLTNALLRWLLPRKWLTALRQYTYLH